MWDSCAKLIFSYHLYHTPPAACNQQPRPVPSCQLIALTQTLQPRVQELCCQTRNLLVLFFKFLSEFLSSNKSTISQIQSKCDLFWSFSSLSKIQPLTHLERKAQGRSFHMNWLLWYFLNTIYKSNISWPFDPYSHKFFVSVKFLSLTDDSLPSAVLLRLLGGTWTGKYSNLHCFIQNYKKMSWSCNLTFRIGGHYSLPKENDHCN